MNKLAELIKPRLHVQNRKLIGGDIPVDGYVISFLRRGRVFKVVGKADIHHQRMEEGSFVPGTIMKSARDQMYAIDRDFPKRKAQKANNDSQQLSLL